MHIIMAKTPVKNLTKPQFSEQTALVTMVALVHACLYMNRVLLIPPRQVQLYQLNQEMLLRNLNLKTTYQNLLGMMRPTVMNLYPRGMDQRRMSRTKQKQKVTK